MANLQPEIRYQRLFETIHIGIILLDFKTRLISDANQFIANLSEFKIEELKGKKISELGLFDKTLSGKRIFNDLKTQTEVIYDNIPLITKSKESKIVELSAHTYISDGKIMIQCTIRDLTEKRAAQKELFETNQRLEALMNSIPVGVTFSMDPKCVRIELNPYMKKMLGMGEAHITATSDSTLISGQKYLHRFLDGREMRPSDLPMQRAIAENRLVGPIEMVAELPTGAKIPIEAHGAPIHDSQGKIIGAVAVNVDLTERRRAKEADRLAQVIEQEKLKLDFINDAAHELRTPLAIIRGNVDLALYNKASSEEALKAINAEVLHLTDLLSDLSLLTTKEREFKRKMSSHQVEVCKLVREMAKRHENFAKEKKIALHIKELPKTRIIGDEYYLERLFANVIVNSISYGKEGGNITIWGKEDKKCVFIMIKDDGIGISEKDLPHIFERFYRAESSRSKDTGGSGLGLAIVKWIVEAHGGSVKVESKLGEGSTFTISFPIAKKTSSRL